ncbi:MAG: PAS domain-containing sensor histidine kinase [Flavobacteriales bacterium]|nr:MAG: PAS domain-containing sensor histidine kinase [Flavobacteriales bacterium]
MEQHDHTDFLKELTDPKQLYENAPCGYLSFTADGKIVMINQTLLSWLGYTKEVVEGQLSYKDLISRGGKIYYEMFYMPLLRLQPHVNEINFDFVRADGTVFPALINSSVFYDQHKKLVAVNATVYNITDRKRYEYELLAAKKQADAERSQFELLSDFIPELIFTANEQGEISYVNKRFNSFFGLNAGSFNKVDVVAKVHPQDRFKLIKNWMFAVQGKSDFQIEVRLQNLNGDFQWHLIRALPVFAADGTVERWMGSCTDINQHVKAIQHLDEFITVASHELKTPITSLNASLQLMERFVNEDENPRLFKFMAQAKRSSDKVKSLVDDLLHTGSLQSGQIALQKKIFSVNDWLSYTCSHVKMDRHFKLEVNCDEELFIDGDEHRIDQVLVNFVNNAMKYAADSKTILIKAESIGEKVKVSVSDQGAGIPTDKLPYLFDRYYRADYEGGSATGLGLGLYICAEIIRRHKGEIGVSSEVGQGSSFWFTLPIATG